ncbi:glycine-rich domain-containing protein [Roseinatronobacter alkalisoli]|uniref:PKD/Chitinase domain-containing protein n=1 Tax=Roseinatronobacter alkalisoli TaxID=3028235 RepID=A0ABT5TFP7_9RHOB|nr:hypothetical protein [Roseinatronobacter sp. HJB301]MDD7972977.1 hypothetical protein [Roseinatronobacter sp. HJB301]
MRGGIWQALGAAAMALILSTGTAVADPRCAAVATGGTVSLIQDGGQFFCVHQFSTAGTSTFNLFRTRTVQHLIVGGGGGGGDGGGGAGGFLTNTVGRSAATYPVIVGGGGAASTSGGNRGSSGGDSSVFSITVGGGGGGGHANVLGGGASGANGRASGGSGGGAGIVLLGAFGGSGSSPGNNGAGSSAFSSGGGGGAGANGSGTNGGAGLSSTITGSTVIYAGGGSALGGTPVAGQNWFGGGGQHIGSTSTSTAGQSGVVILRYIANFPPTANAGPDIAVTAGSPIVLNGNGSNDPEDNIISYAWTQMPISTVTLTDADTVQANFTAGEPANGSSETLTFQLTVTDAFGASSTDQITVTVLSSVNPPPPSGSGGNTVTQFNDLSENVTWRVHSFTESADFNLNSAGTIEYLIVGGGGGGGAVAGGGGGAGGVRPNTSLQPAGTYPVTVGSGGAGDSRTTWPTAPVQGGADGQPSSVFGVSALGGGGGGTYNSSTLIGNGRTGASGGGGSHQGTGGTGTAGQGFNGATGTIGLGDSSGGGGGGAGQSGAAGTTSFAGRGGDGISSDITGDEIFYGGGGAGGGDIRDNLVQSNSGGLGGGGASRNNQAAGENGVNGLGGGGAGGRVGDNGIASQGGTGGSGVVILRYVINTGPTANAGPDATAFPGLQVTLDGAGTFDPDGNIVSYAWAQTSGPPVALGGASSLTPSFTPAQPVSGAQDTLVFQLTVTDDFGLTSTDTVTITVQGVADLTASKTVTVFSEDGSNCENLNATPPTEPGNPAAIPGACIQYVISVENSGPVAAQGITLIDALPESLKLRVTELGSGWGTGTSLVFTQGCSGIECRVEIRDGVIEANTSATLTIRATIN